MYDERRIDEKCQTLSNLARRASRDENFRCFEQPREERERERGMRIRADASVEIVVVVWTLSIGGILEVRSTSGVPL